MILENNISVKNDVFDLFTKSQKTAAGHQRDAIILKNLYEESKEEVCPAIEQVINAILIQDKNSGPYLEKVMDFFATFCSILPPEDSDDLHDETMEYVENSLLTHIFSYLLKASQLEGDTIRLRSLQLINKILDRIVGNEVSEDLCEKLENTILIRLQDPKNTIRQQAVCSLHRLQDPTNQEDSIIAEFIRLMNTDSFAKVRQLCIEKVAARRDVIGHIIKRIRDVDANVRLSAYKRLTTFAGFLKITEKRLILHCGFLDESDKVRELVSTTLLNAWLEYYDNDIIKFMRSIRLDADEKDIDHSVTLFEYCLLVIFKNKQLAQLSDYIKFNESNLIPFEHLDWEMASYWRIYVQFLSKNEEFEEELDKVVPDLVYFCKYIKEYYMTIPKEVTTVEFLEQQFILKQFFLITRTYDYADISNRKCFNALVCDILENAVLMSDVTEVILSNLEFTIPNIDRRTQFVSEIISDILYPMNSEESKRVEDEKQFQICQLMVKLNCLREELSEAISRQTYIEAERLKNEIAVVSTNLADMKKSEQRQVEKKTDAITTIKCLDIAAAILLSTQVTRLTSSLKALKEDFIQELLIHDNDNIRVKALKCYGLCCIVDKLTSSTGIHIFSTPIFAYQSGEECDTQTLLICIAAVVDLLRIYGAQLMAAPENDELSETVNEKHQAVFAGGTSLTDVLQGLVDLMDDEQYEIQEKAGLGICQLILSGRILSPSLISRLIVKWCNPASDDEVEADDRNRLKQIIGFTLEKIALMPECCQELKDAVLMTIRALLAAPRISPLADVNVDNIAKFMLALCKTSPQGLIIHTDLARTICLEMENKPKSKINLVFSKMLLLLDTPENQIHIEELLNICDRVRDNISERIIVNNIVKFTALLQSKNRKNMLVINEEPEE